ncbi:hypothetical protein [Limnohabitans sp. B9-3]|uniref:hypothetical protein n=1 Tax=Limnohabitans sp. B9-3 TaxID=1100707 RepID=UPI000C1E99E0|nr:hypothetical protein [Limnohabitans sp. B9-3]PIT72384.1 hypothetical protein B9Z42_12600 [Limnohabitans sp. B9-3]
MAKFFSFFRSDQHLLADTSLSRFVRDASSAEKKKIYSRVIAKATEDQNKVIELAKNLESQKVSIGVRSQLFVMFKAFGHGGDGQVATNKADDLPV